MTRFQKLYREKVAPELVKKFDYKSPMEVPVSYTHLTLPTICSV